MAEHYIKEEYRDCDIVINSMIRVLITNKKISIIFTFLIDSVSISFKKLMELNSMIINFLLKNKCIKIGRDAIGISQRYIEERKLIRNQAY